MTATTVKVLRRQSIEHSALNEGGENARDRGGTGRDAVSWRLDLMCLFTHRLIVAVGHYRRANQQDQPVFSTKWTQWATNRKREVK